MEPGRCGKEKELMDFFSHKKSAPCVVLSAPYRNAIWPKYNANECPMWVGQ